MKEGWEYKKLGDVATFINGFAFKPTQWGESGIPIIRIQNLNNPVAPFNYFDGDIPIKYLVKKGDILISWSASLGAYEWTGENAYLNQHIFKVIFDKADIDKHFLKYAVTSKLSEMDKDAHGATMRHIVKKDFDNTIIPFPPLSEQQHIVEELDLLSSIIEKKKAQLNELDNLAQSLFYEMFGDPTKTSKGWEVKKMGDVCILKSGNSDANKSASGDLPYVKVGDMNLEGNETYIVLSSTYVDRVANARNIFPIGTIIFPKRGGAILTNKKRLTKTDICCDLNVMGVIPNTDIVIPLYVYYYFLRIDFSVFANTGSTIPQINNYDIAPMNIVLPPMDVQNQFASKIEAIDNQKELIKQSIKEVETLFNSRMDYYFN